MYIPKENRTNKSQIPFTGCDEKTCPFTDCIRHPSNNFQYNSMGHLSYLCKKYKEEMQKKKDENTTKEENKVIQEDKETPIK